ncbi:microcin C transport system substrate-binding protein [Poseidonocella pacifica]|uniref:Microcin C transport system substrate-binding protein n=1 Tax=Poseidonocella pacifica TaxID=871651 RepID=A0A1I0XKK3_9RHOB|nr:extracellular solute-binding protein [Poseidonocella pacifica]SFB00850.1 microcin C transport system substrate-binding protein [Poseidonocella pacifica]
MRNRKEPRSATRPSPRWHLGVAAIAVLLGQPALAQETVTTTHAYNYFGEPKYGPDFKRLEYVNADAPKGGEISIWAPGTFDSFNPYTIKGRSGALASIGTEDLLTTTADDITSLYCLLCETMEYPESLDWVVFNLRPEAEFSDGTPISAEDIKFSYDILMDQGLPSFRAAFGSIINTVEVLGPQRIKFTFNEDAPRRDVIGLAGAMPAFSKEWYEETGARLDETRLDPGLTSGPYQLESYDINQRIVYKRNPDYWGNSLPINIGRNNFDTIRVEYFGDASASFEGFKAGAYTFRVENSSRQWATGYDIPAIEAGHIVKAELNDGTMATGQSFVFNLRREKFQDPRVREAIALMFNFEWSNEALFYGLYERINSLWENSDMAADGIPSDAEKALLQPLVDEGLLEASILTDEAVMAPTSSDRQLDRRNLRRASQLLEEAGWIVGQDGLRRKDGRTLEVEFLEDSPTFDRVINPYVANLRQLGVDARLSRVDPAQATDRTRNFDFDMTTHQMPMSYEPGSGLKQYFGSEAVNESPRNAMGIADPAVDRLIDTVIRADTQEEMTVAVRALDRVLRAKRFWVPQWYKDTHTVAYYDMYEHPDPLPPFARGELDFWWYNAEKAEKLRAAGALK